MSDRLAGKVVVVTGTAGGQGRAAAQLFASEGAVVVGTDLDAEGAKETLALVESSGGRMSSTQPLDLTDEAAVASWMDTVVDEHGGVDILYNNAGAARFSPIDEVTYDEWSFVLRNELDVVFLPTKYAWPHLKRSQRGPAVVMVGSTAGVAGSTTNPRAAHTVTKGGIIALTRQLAAEGAPHGIRVNCISPGMILTPATAKDLLAWDHPMREIHRDIPMRRVGTPEEVAKCALFLASDDASYVTGTNLMVDGGWSTVLPGTLTAP